MIVKAGNLNIPRVLGRLVVFTLFLSACGLAWANDDNWTSEKVGRGITSSIALDSAGNVHVTYLALDAKVYYGFRPAASERWFTISVLESTHSIQNIFPRVAVDGNGQPHLCVAMGELKYITLRNQKWSMQDIDPGSGTLSYHCSIALGADGSPHLSWYHEFLPGGKQFTHLRYADLENGVWVVRSVDGGISGKWNSLVLDSKGFPHLSYSQWISGGDLRYAEWDGKGWVVSEVDSTHKASDGVGYDNSLALGADGSPHISFLDIANVKYAHQKDGKWVVENVARISSGYDYYGGSTTLLLDKQGSPHIIFGDLGCVKHVFLSGDKWRTEVIVSGGVQQYSNVDAAIGADDTLYVSYPDPEDGFVKVAIGKLTQSSEHVRSDEKDPKPDQEKPNLD